jgi:vomeronasal 2 receptor
MNQAYMYWTLFGLHEADPWTKRMFSWIFIFWFLQINKFVSAANYIISSCYYKISEEFHHEGDVVIGAFLPLHTFHTGKKKPHSTIPYYYLDNKIQ